MSQVREIELNGIKVKCYSCGKIESFYKNKWREIGSQRKNGYCHVCINNKFYLSHRVIGFAFLNLDIDNLNQQIDHKDRVRNNNDVSNLRVVSNQQNDFNRTAKGYYHHNQNKKWIAQITLNRKRIYLGSFDTEDEAQRTYLVAKEKYHII